MQIQVLSQLVLADEGVEAISSYICRCGGNRFLQMQVWRQVVLADSGVEVSGSCRFRCDSVL